MIFLVAYLVVGFVCYLALRNLRHWNQYQKVEIKELALDISRLVRAKDINGDLKLRYIALYISAATLGTSCFMFFMSFLQHTLEGQSISTPEVLGHATSLLGIVTLWYAVFKRVRP